MAAAKSARPKRSGEVACLSLGVSDRSHSLICSSPFPIRIAWNGRGRIAWIGRRRIACICRGRIACTGRGRIAWIGRCRIARISLIVRIVRSIGSAGSLRSSLRSGGSCCALFAAGTTQLLEKVTEAHGCPHTEGKFFPVLLENCSHAFCGCWRDFYTATQTLPPNMPRRIEHVKKARTFTQR